MLNEICQLGEAIGAMAAVHLRRGLLRGAEAQAKEGPHDLVTEIDRQVETFARRQVAALFPDHGFVGEEYGPEREAAEWLWVVDPVDGTNNFARQIHLACFSLAVMRQGRPEFGLIVDPFRDEWFRAVRGEGATLNGEPIAVRDCPDLGGGLLLLELSSGRVWPEMAGLSTRMATVHGLTRILGTTALSLAWVAAGRATAVALHGSKPWDTAAGTLLVTEAGGSVRAWDGPYPALAGGPLLGGGQAAVATLGAWLQELRDAHPAA